MKRFRLIPDVTWTQNPMSLEREARCRSAMQESDSGEWVRWEDVQRVIDDLEAQIPDKRIARLEMALKLVHEGRCPECGRVVRGYEPPEGLLAPEMWATLREVGVDPATGHLKTCSMNKKL